MFNKLAKMITGDPVQKQLDEYKAKVDQINALEPAMQALPDEALQGKTAAFKARLRAGESLDDLLIEAFAVVREASVRTIGLRHFDVQLIGGMVLHDGIIAEMRTGEGKTLVATMPIYLNALEEKGVHLVTVNDYLARRDARWMGPIFDFLGMSVGVLQQAARTESGRKAFVYDPDRESTQEDVHRLRMVDRKAAYAADVTYGTNNEFGFDYLRDNMARRLDARSQRGHHYAILDEVDNILIDEARTPLIISGPSHEDPETYERMAQVVKKLDGEDYEISERDRTIALTELGENHVEELLGVPLRDPDRPEELTDEQARLLGYLEQALRAQYLFKRNRHYVVQGGKVIIVDEFTGRLMPGRRWSDGLHQAVEAKEGVKVRQENVTYATITLQNYFRMYTKLAGMTGTAVTEEEEFHKIYDVDVIALPTNLDYTAMLPETDLETVEFRENGNRFVYYTRGDDETPVFWKRKDYADQVYRTEEAKMRALALEILTRHVRGQPILVGTTSVEMSERVSQRLRSAPLQKLASIMVLRDVYFDAHGLSDDGMRVEALDPLMAPLDSIQSSTLRQFSSSLDVSSSPHRPENLARLCRVLDLPPDHAQRLDEVLKAGIRHNVLNAKKHDEESAIIAGAGALNAVTIATNMAGRGVDIKLGGDIAEEVLAAVNRVLRRMGVEDPEATNLDERAALLEQADADAIGIYDGEVGLFQQFIKDEIRVKELGGLHVLGSERHESRRIDNQLRGRSARQGDPGSSQFLLSLEDELMRLFGGSQVSSLMERLNIDETMPIEHNIVNRTIEQAQVRVEGAHFDTRKHLLEYDDVLNQQREIFYAQRNRVFAKSDLREDVRAMVRDEVQQQISAAEIDPDGLWKLLAWLEETQPTLNLNSEEPYPSFMLHLLVDHLRDAQDAKSLRDGLMDIAERSLDRYHDHLLQTAGEQFDRSIERLSDQARQRASMADTAIEAAILEAEEAGQGVDAEAIMRALESAVGVRVRRDSAGIERIEKDPQGFRKQIPSLVEASLGLRVWAGIIHTLERRLGESLGLESSLPSPIDWDAARERLLDALEGARERRMESLLKEVRTDLGQSLPDGTAVDDALKIRLLVRMSYGERAFFDKKTHQRRAVRVMRLTYAFYAAQLLVDEPLPDLTERIVAYLLRAEAVIERSFGFEAFQRLSGSKLEELDEQFCTALEQSLGDQYAAIPKDQPLATLGDKQRNVIQAVLGETSLIELMRGLFLSVGDRLWVDYLTQMEALRTSIGLEAYGQRDPLVQYKSRAFDLFGTLQYSIRSGVVARLFRSRPATAAAATARQAQGADEQARSSSRKPSSGKSKGSRKRRRRRG